jgi:hypothetical protein
MATLFFRVSEPCSGCVQSVECILLMQCDQFGTLHPPFAPARAHLVEGGFESVPFLVHTAPGGELAQVKVSDLVGANNAEITAALKNISENEHAVMQAEAKRKAAAAAAAAAEKDKRDKRKAAAAAKK